MATVVVAAEQGKRPDVNVVHWTALQAGWYRAKIAAAGVAVAVRPGAVVTLARELFLQRRSRASTSTIRGRACTRSTPLR
jgi:hypothetical protein